MVQRKDGEMRHVSTYIRPEVFKRLRDLAEDDGLPVSDVVASLIERFVASRET